LIIIITINTLNKKLKKSKWEVISMVNDWFDGPKKKGSGDYDNDDDDWDDDDDDEWDDDDDYDDFDDFED